MGVCCDAERKSIAALGFNRGESQQLSQSILTRREEFRFIPGAAKIFFEVM